MMSTDSTASTMSSGRALHVLVTAHPDDESMFFLPTLFHLLRTHQERVWLLCLSQGNYDGLGQIRETELHKACARIGPFEKIVCWHDELLLPDHPTKPWSASVIGKVLEEVLAQAENECDEIRILTFDEYGVSGHVNHQCTYHGVRHYLHRQNEIALASRKDLPQVYGWKLRSEMNVPRKYLSFPLDWMWMGWVWVLRIWARMTSRSTSVCGAGSTARTGTLSKQRAVAFLPSYSSTSLHLYKPLLSYRTMTDHRSQWVWYRRLFVLFSCYTYRNEWSRIRMDEEGSGREKTH